MPVADGFQPLHGDKASHPACMDELLDLPCLRGIAQNMADGEDGVVPLDCIHNIAACLLRRCHGFFQKDCVAEVGKGDCRGLVLLIQRADKDGVCQLGEPGGLLPATEAHGLGNAAALSQGIPVFIAWLSDSDDAGTFRTTQGKFRIGGSAGTASDDQKSDW